MTNSDTSDNIHIDGTEIEKMTNYKYLGQTKSMENRTRQGVFIRLKAGYSGVFSKVQRNLSGHAASIESKKKPVCLASSVLWSSVMWMPNMVSCKSGSKET